MRHLFVFSMAILLVVWSAPAGEPRPRHLADADRILLLGGGFIEQERLHCYLETRLIRHHPGGRLSFRNLGWSGDTVRGSARTGGFRNPEGFARLMKEVAQWKPTVILIGYGMNESFSGADGIPSFVKDYGALVDKLTPLGVRVILLSPTYHEPLGPPYPDASGHNRHLATYSEAIRELARTRNIEFIGLFYPMKKAKEAEPTRALTTNGIQPSAAGYAVIARTVEEALGYRTTSGWRVTVSATGGVKEAVGARVKMEAAKRGLRLSVQEAALAIADPLGDGEHFLKVTDLADGVHVFEVDGKATARLSAKASELRIWAHGHAGERLRQAIIAKGELFYRRWRPFNDHSRHFDFMKGDFSLYDQAIAAQERVIESLLVPRTYTIDIVPGN